MVPTWGRNSSNIGMRSSSSLYKAHYRTALDNGRGGDGSRRGHSSSGDVSGGGRRSGDSADLCHGRVIRNQQYLYP